MKMRRATDGGRAPRRAAPGESRCLGAIGRDGLSRDQRYGIGRAQFATMDHKRSQDVQPTFCVFLAEDDRELRGWLAEVLRRDGHLVYEAADGETMLFHLLHRGLGRQSQAAVEAELVICDVRMPRCDGLTVLRNLRDHGVSCPAFVFTTAFPDADTLNEASTLGALRVFEKPFELAELRTLVRARAAEAQSSLGSGGSV